MNKIIARVIYKPREGVKNYIFKLENNVLQVETLFLTKEIWEDEKLLCTKFNHNLYLRIGKFSLETIEALYETMIREDLKGSYRLNPNK